MTGWRSRCLLMAIILPIVGCGRDGPIADLLGRDRTPHEAYAEALRSAGLDSTALGRDWLVAADSALRAAHATTLPMMEVGTYTREDARAIAHRVELNEGQRLLVTVQTEGIPARIFVDLFAVTADTTEPFAPVAFALPDSASPTVTLSYEAREPAQFVVRYIPNCYVMVAIPSPCSVIPQWPFRWRVTATVRSRVDLG